MLQEVGEPFGAIGGLERQAGGHGSSDDQELSLDGGCHPTRSPLDRRIEPTHRPFQASHHGERGALPVAVLGERDDLSHPPMMRTASDTTLADGSRQATRTELTGASRSRTVNQDAPPSPDPNTSPDVAPK
jgi:hypothetical protein